MGLKAVDHIANWNSHTGNHLSCLIRITTKCNEKCAHCCFRCSPSCADEMSIETATKIGKWLPSNVTPSISGGELTLVENYPEIADALTGNSLRVGIMTNGAWIQNEQSTEKFLATVRLLEEKCEVLVGISNDPYHGDNSKLAANLLHAVRPRIQLRHEYTTTVVRVGRAWDNNIGNWQCRAACETYSTLTIGEDGVIYGCPFGYFPWRQISELDYKTARQTVYAWRAARIASGMTCKKCMQKVDAEIEGHKKQPEACV